MKFAELCRMQTFLPLGSSTLTFVSRLMRNFVYKKCFLEKFAKNLDCILHPSCEISKLCKTGNILRQREKKIKLLLVFKFPAMSFTSITKSTETDSDSCYEKRRHPYNTRYSSKNSNARQVFTTKKVTKPVDECLPAYRSDRKRGTRDASTLEAMDYCYDPCLAPPRQKRRNPFCSFLLGCFYIIVFTGALILLYTQYLMHREVEKLKDEVNKIRGGSRREDPHAKLSKELDKKCSDTLKLLLKDPVGRPDFALESSGGRVISVDSIAYSNPKTFLGFTLCEGEHGPSSMIQATSSPGECWAFKGHSGKAVLQLIDYVLIDSVTLEHIPPTISPSGTIDTAPKDFKIWGLQNLNGPKTLLGKFTYENNSGTIQTFNINNETTYYRYIEFEVLSNHGNKEFTCVYRIRVHGTARRYTERI